MAPAGPAQGQTAALTLVLLGRGGSGKSSAGNTILGRKEFKTSLTSRAVTTECQRAETQIHGRRVAVIDTPDFFDQACPDPGAQIQRCRDLSAPGAHVFLLVLQLGRFSQGKKMILKQIQQKFGPGVTRHIVVLFTHGDDLEGETEEKFLKNSQKDFQELIRECGSRYQVFNNKTASAGHPQVPQLLEKINRLVAQNGGELYPLTALDRGGSESQAEGMELGMTQEDTRKQAGEQQKKSNSSSGAGPAQGQTAALTLVLLGRGGSGKSSAGNTILGRKEFKTSLSSRAVTTECQRAETQIHGRRVAMIDTPDFFDQACPDPGAQIQRCLDLSAPGPHVFLLVLQLGRFSQGEKKILTQIQQKFGPGVTRHIVILFTHGDDLEGETEEEFLKNSQKDLRELIRECGSRYQVFNNKTASAGHPQVPQLLEKINRLVAQNRGEWNPLTALDRGGSESQAEVMELGMTQEDIRKQAEELQRWNRQKKSNSSSGDQLQERRIVLIGKTGVGKSASGNTILGRKGFKSALSTKSVTKCCEKQSTEFDGRRVAVIDTPGIFDTDVPDEYINPEIVRCVHVSCPGPHAFLLVIQVGRFTEEEKNTVEALQELFGERANSYTIVLFTRGDDLEDETIDDYVENTHQDLREVIRKCGSRYHVFNNKDMKNRTQVRELLTMIDRMVEANGGGYYTQEMFEEAEKKIREKEEEMKRKLSLEHRQELQILEKQQKLELMSMKQEAMRAELERTHQERIEELKKKHQEELKKIREEAENSQYNFSFIKPQQSSWEKFKDLFRKKHK